MTISTTTIRAPYAGNGSTTVFAVNFPFLEDADLLVILTDAAGVETVQTITTHYSVTGAGTGSGNVTMVTAPASGETLTIIGDPAPLQPLDLVDNDPLPAEELEDALDRAMLVVQRALDLNTRAFRLAESDTGSAELPTAISRASKYLAFDASGDPIASSGPTGTSDVPVSAFMETVLDDASAAAARATLGAGDAQLSDANVFLNMQTWVKGADVASATALTLGGDGNWYDVTGTTAITSIGTLGVGTLVILHFDAALTLTHHSTDLVLGGANIVTAAGDIAVLYEYATGDWRLVSYRRGMSAAQTYFRATMSANQGSLAAGTHTLAFNTEAADPGSNYNNSTYTYTTPTAGLYQFGGYSKPAGGLGSENKIWRIQIDVDGANHLVDEQSVASGTHVEAANGTIILPLAAGQAVKMELVHDSGSNEEASATDAVFWGMRIAP